MRKAAVCLAMALASCGGRSPPRVLSGDVPTSLVFVGDWPEQERGATRAFIETLETSGYFAPMNRERGADPHFRVVLAPEAALLTVTMWAPGTRDAGPHRGIHGTDGNRVTIDVYGAGRAALADVSPTLSHELAETAADPDLDGDEVADLCESRGPAVQFSVSGVLRFVARYMTTSGCWPAA